MPQVIPAPLAVPLVDPSGQISPLWSRFFISAQAAIDPGSAPSDARYWTSTANSALSQETNLGLLSPSGYLKVAIALGIATPSTTATIPATDLSGVVGVAHGGTGADLSATGGTSRVLKQTSAGAAVSVAQLASTDITDLASGTYTPTLTNSVNVAASTAYPCQYLRVGSVVTVSGRVDIDPTGAGDTQLGLSLPIASNLSAPEQLAGTAVSAAVAGLCAAVLGDATANRATVQYVAVDLANRTFSFSFQYLIV